MKIGFIKQWDAYTQCNDFVMTVSCLKTSRRAFHVGKWLIVQDSGECQVSTR